MPEELLREFRRVARATKIGSACMYAIAVLLTVMMLVSCLVRPQTTPLAFLEVAKGLLRQCSAIVATVLLAEFLRSFGRARSPFGRTQSLRLVSAGALILLSTALDLFRGPQSYRLELVEEGLALSATSQQGINPVLISLVVFLFCLALVVRYGDALKEDSDSIA